MTQAKSQVLSDAEHMQIATAWVEAKTEGDRDYLEATIKRLIADGAIDKQKLFDCVAVLQEQQEKPVAREKSSKSDSSGGNSKGNAKQSSSSSNTGGGDRNSAGDRSKDKTLVFSFRFIRGLVLVTNVAPYRIILTSLLPRTAIAEVYAWLFKMPILGVIGMTLAGYLLWYALQSMETAKGAGLWPVRAIAYVVDAFLCFATFPPLIGGISALGLFVFAGTFSDVDWPNFAICVFAIGAWEALNYIERKVFKGCDFGFWGVKIR